MHGPEKRELLQHIIKWKEKENFDNTICHLGLFLSKKTKNKTKQNITPASLYMQSFTDIIKVMIPQMISVHQKTNTVIFAQIVIGYDSPDGAM